LNLRIKSFTLQKEAAGIEWNHRITSKGLNLFFAVVI